MAAPQRQYRYEQEVPRAVDRQFRRGGSVKRRTVTRKGSSVRVFVALAVLPVALMLGSVYVHASAAWLDGEVVRLADEKARAEAEAERLEVKIAELSRPERVRSVAEEDLGMRDPEGEDLMTFDGSYGEDATENAEEDQ